MKTIKNFVYGTAPVTLPILMSIVCEYIFKFL